MNSFYKAKILFLFSFVLSINVLFAQKETTLKLQESPQSIQNGFPQTPHAPYPYDTVEVEYDNVDKTVHLAATLSYPKTGGPFTTVVMITGSGQQDRDETILGHKPFAVIADFLTRNGYAVLKVDDRGKGKSKGELNKATSMDFAEDVITSVHYAATLQHVNKNSIGLMGHSEGGFIAPIVYSKCPEISFIVSLAGTGVSGADILFKQQTDPVRGMVSSEAFAAYEKLTAGTLGLIKENVSMKDSALLALIRNHFAEWKKEYNDSILTALNAKKATPEQYGFQVMTELRPWFRYFIATDPAIYWSQVHCPVLILNGEKDIQVYPDQNTTAIAKALDKGGNKKYDLKIFPGLNHLFQHCDKCTVQEYGKLKETFSIEVLNYINDWMGKWIVSNK